MPTAIITGASKGLGYATAIALAQRGWDLVIDARDPRQLRRAAVKMRRAGSPFVREIAGDVGDPMHRLALAAAARNRGVDVIVNNASSLGTLPLPHLQGLTIEALHDTLQVNLVAPLALTRALLPELRERGGIVVNISSDAAVEAYPGWGAYSIGKAGLDQLTAVLAAEEPRLRAYAFDPGDMRTDLHRAAVPDADLDALPDPATVVPALLRLLDERRPSGRYRASDIGVEVAA